MSCLKLFSPHDGFEGESAPPRLRVVCCDDADEVDDAQVLPFPMSTRQTVCVLRMTPPCPVCKEVSLGFGEAGDLPAQVPALYPRLWRPERSEEEPGFIGETEGRTCSCRRCGHVWQVADEAVSPAYTATETGRFAVVR